MPIGTLAVKTSILFGLGAVAFQFQKLKSSQQRLETEVNTQQASTPLGRPARTIVPCD